MKKIAVLAGPSKSQYYINKTYVEYVKKAGYEPILVFPGNDPGIISQLCQGLVIPGGIDLDPTYYGNDNLCSLSINPEKDMFEREMLHAFAAIGKPIFGICRGFQLIVNEWLVIEPGISCFMHYSQNTKKHSLADELSAPRTAFTHRVMALPELYGSQEEDLGISNIFVNSMHHQALIATWEVIAFNIYNEVPGNTSKKELEIGNAKILAYTFHGMPTAKKEQSQYAVVEAIEVKIGNSTCRGVQWHPEELSQVNDRDLDLLRALFSPAEEGDNIEKVVQ